MSIGRPSRCLLCIFKQSQRLIVPQTRRSLFSTPIRRADDSKSDEQSPRKDIVIDEQGVKSQKVTEQEWKKQYEPRQVEAIKAAQELIGDKFEKGNNVVRTDPWSVDYYDDFENINPVADLPVRAPWKNLDDDAKLRDTEDAISEFLDFEQSLPKQREPGKEPNAIRIMKKFDEMRLLTGRAENELDAPSAMMPTAPGPKIIPKLSTDAEKTGDKSGEREDAAKSRSKEQFTPELVRLMQMTGLSAQALAKLRVKTIVTDRVSNQTRLGKVHKMKFISVAGNGDGLLGIGEGKSDEPANARLQSQYRAIRNMQPVRRYEKRTIYGTVNAKVSATELELYARPPGFGLRCQHLIWEMANCAGIYDLSARVTRARNPMNTVKAAYKALLSQKDPEDIARGRGKKMVDVRKVYYAGMVQ